MNEQCWRIGFGADCGSTTPNSDHNCHHERLVRLQAYLKFKKMSELKKSIHRHSRVKTSNHIPILSNNQTNNILFAQSQDTTNKMPKNSDVQFKLVYFYFIIYKVPSGPSRGRLLFGGESCVNPRIYSIRIFYDSFIIRVNTRSFT